MASERCDLCGLRLPFQAKRNRYERVSINSKVKAKDQTLKLVLEDFGRVFSPKKGYTCVCNECQLKIAKLQKYSESKVELTNCANNDVYIGRKVLGTSVPVKAKKIHNKINSKTNVDYKKAATKYLRGSKYSSLFKTLIKNSISARQAMIQEVKRLVSTEIKNLIKPSTNSLWRNISAKKGIFFCSKQKRQNIYRINIFFTKCKLDNIEFYKYILLVNFKRECLRGFM